MKRTPISRLLNEWFGGNKSLRDQLVGFGVSCGLHVLLLLTLSLIAIGSGAVPGALLLTAAPSGTEDDAAITSEAEWMPAPELADAPPDVPSVEFELADIEASVPKLDLPSQTTTVSRPTDSSTTKANKSNARSGAAGGNATGAGNGLDGMQALAAAGIQSRVSKAGGKKGEVQFALAWRNINDLDLHVIVPSGEHISHQHRRSKCSGMLDVDMNVEGESDEPVENVRWLRNAPWGRYTILINFFRLNVGNRRPQRNTPYELLVQLGKESLMREAVAGFGERQVTVWRFIYVPSSFSSIERERMLEQVQDLQNREDSLATPLLEQARSAQGPARQRQLQNLVQLYPHTDAAIEALQLMDGEVVKRPSP